MIPDKPEATRDWTLVAIGACIGLLSALSPHSGTAVLTGMADRIDSFVVNGAVWAGALVIGRHALGRRWRRVLWASGVLACVLAVDMAVKIAILRARRQERHQSGSGSIRAQAGAPQRPTSPPGWAALTGDERTRVEKLMVAALTNPSSPTNADRAEMSSLVRKMVGGNATAGDLESALEPIRKRVTGVAIKYQGLFWDDARQALAFRRPTKSVDREAYEKELVAEGLMTEFRVRQNEALMENIAYGRPVTLPGGAGSMVLDEGAVSSAAARVAAASARLETLLTPIDESETASRR